MEQKMLGMSEARKDGAFRPVELFHELFHHRGTMEQSTERFRRQLLLHHHIGLLFGLLTYVRVSLLPGVITHPALYNSFRLQSRLLCGPGHLWFNSLHGFSR